MKLWCLTSSSRMVFQNCQNPPVRRRASCASGPDQDRFQKRSNCSVFPLSWKRLRGCERSAPHGMHARPMCPKTAGSSPPSGRENAQGRHGASPYATCDHYDWGSHCTFSNRHGEGSPAVPSRKRPPRAAPMTGSSGLMSPVVMICVAWARRRALTPQSPIRSLAWSRRS